jgi:hypothetical protein
MITVGYGDLTPQTPLETVLVTFIMFLGSGVFGFMINQIGSIISEINQSSMERENEQELLTNFLHSKQMPTELTQRALVNLDYIHQFSNITRVN